MICCCALLMVTNVFATCLRLFQMEIKQKRVKILDRIYLNFYTKRHDCISFCLQDKWLHLVEVVGNWAFSLFPLIKILHCSSTLTNINMVTINFMISNYLQTSETSNKSIRRAWRRETLQAEYVLHCNRFQMVLENVRTQAPREIGQPWREDTSGCQWWKKYSFSFKSINRK